MAAGRGQAAAPLVVDADQRRRRARSGGEQLPPWPRSTASMSPWKSRWSWLRLVKTARSKRTPSTRPSSRAWLDTSIVTADGAALAHDGQQGVQVRGLGRGPGGREHLVADVRGDRADHPGGVPAGAQGGVEQVARGRLAVGAGDAGGAPAPGRDRRTPRPTPRRARPRGSSTTSTGTSTPPDGRDQLGPGRVGEDRRRAGGLGHRGEPGPVGGEAGQCGVQVAGPHPSGVQGDAGDDARAARPAARACGAGRLRSRGRRSVGSRATTSRSGSRGTSCPTAGSSAPAARRSSRS